MTHIVTERCVDCRYTDCCAVCPVECFYEVKEPAMLVIDPVTCIDCGLCIPECPIYAIYPKNEVPAYYQDWIQKNADLWPKGVKTTAKTQALPSALPLDQIKARERSRGWAAKDPSAVSDEGSGGGTAHAAPAAAAVAAPPPPPPGAAAPAGEKRQRVRLPKGAPRPPLGIGPGARVRLQYRTGTVEELRKGHSGEIYDVLILLDGDPRPAWYLYSSLQTLKEKGELTILDPGRGSGLLARMFSP